MEQLDDLSDIEVGTGVMSERAGRPAEKNLTRFIDGPTRIYRATPWHIWMNDIEVDDSGHYVRDVRRELSVDALRDLNWITAN